MPVPRFLVAATFLLSAMFLPSLLFADSGTDFSNGGGTLAVTASDALSLSGSTLIAVTGYQGGGLLTGTLGTVTFTTGALASGSLDMGGTLGGGGSFVIVGNGTDGLSGTLFSGKFVAPVTWALVTLANGTHNYTLTGVVSGTMGGLHVDAVTVQLTINTGKDLFDGSTMIAGGDTTVVGSVPEPSTLALFGTGALTMIGMIRRRIAS
jgi:PEP-CTERM motif